MDDEQQLPEDGASDFAVPGVARPSPLTGLLGQLRCAVEAFRAAAAVLSDDDCREGVRDLAGFLGQAESTWLGLVADLDSRPGAVPGAYPKHVARSFLTGGLNRTVAQARRDDHGTTSPDPTGNPSDSDPPTPNTKPTSCASTWTPTPGRQPGPPPGFSRLQ